MRPASDPLSEPQIHAAIRALDAGDRPHRDTLRTALLMALAWHAAQAEIVALRAELTARRARETLMIDIGLPHDPDKADKIVVSTTQVQAQPYVHVAVYDVFGNPVAFALKPYVAKNVAHAMWQRGEELDPTDLPYGAQG